MLRTAVAAVAEFTVSEATVMPAPKFAVVLPSGFTVTRSAPVPDTQLTPPIHRGKAETGD
jgi:hypothetical protein